MYADKPGLFNTLMVKYLDDIDRKLDTIPTPTDIDEHAPSRTEAEIEQVPLTQL